MKRNFFIFTFLAVAGSFMYAQAIDKPVATIRLIKPQTITVKQLRKILDPLEERAKQATSKEQRVKLLDSLIARALIEQAAERDKVSVSDAQMKGRIEEVKKLAAAQIGRDITDTELQNLLKAQGVTWDDFQKDQKYQLLAQNYALFKNKGLFESVAQPTDGDARTYYEANKTKEFVWDDTVRLRWILVDTTHLTSKDERDKAAKRAEDIYKEYKAGAKFDDLVTKYSDDTSSKYKGGDVGFLVRSNDQQKQTLGADFFNTVFSMKKNDTSGVLPCNVGYAIVQVTDRIDAKILGFEDKIPPLYEMTVKDRIKAGLLQQRQSDAFAKALSDIVADLRKEAEVKTFEDNLSW